MRDHPNHGSKILGGLWGGFNYKNFKLAVKARSNLQHQHCDHCRRHISTSKSTPSPGKLCTAYHQAANMVTISTFSRGEYGHLLGAPRSSSIWFLVNVFTFLLLLPLNMVNCAGEGP